MPSWSRVRAVFEEVADLPATDRTARLATLCGDDTELRAAVERLLVRDASDAAPAIEAVAVVDVGEDGTGGPGRLRRVGGFEIVRAIGSGGMGTVFEARQERPRRTVALKVLRTLASPAAHRRLEYEAETLARLQHPNIAQVHECGTFADPETGEELPFFAMEYVADATRITDYADAQRLGLRDRIALFLPVCDAVQHGHQQGVLHRDLKPANILVDADGRPKVIDFGIARATDVADGDRPVRTLTGQVLGTPGYMSPEQLDGDPARVDVRADVYGLAATLHELLVGAPPLPRGDEALGQYLRRLREAPMPRPSTVETATVSVPAELDWVLLRALAVDPAERYGSVSELAAELRRFLADEPLLARPPTRSYLVRKFVHRYRVAVGATLAVACALVVGAVATTIGWLRASDARDQATEVARELLSLTMLQSDILRGGRGDRGTLLVDVLDRAAEQLERRPPKRRRVAGGLHHALGIAFLDLGDLDKAERHFEAALAFFENEPLLRESWIRARGDYASVFAARGQVDAAEQIRRELLQAKIEMFGAEHWEVDLARVQLATVLNERQQYDQALSLARESLRGLREPPPGVSSYYESVLVTQALALHGLKRDEEAIELYSQAIELLAERHGPRDLEVLSTRNSRAVSLLDLGRLDEAADDFRELWQALREVAGPAHPRTMRAATNLGLCFEREERYAEAAAVHREVLQARADAELSEDLVSLVARFNLAVALHRQDGAGQLEAALAQLDELLQRSAGLLPADGWRVAVFRQHRGIVLRKLERYEEAERELLAAAATVERRLGPDHKRTRSNWEQLAVLYEAWARPGDAARWRERLAAKTDG